jgi:hypothetical protein
VFKSFTATTLCRIEIEYVCVVSLSLRCVYGSVRETQVSVLSGDGLSLVPRPVWKKCSSQSKGFLVVISLYGQGVVEDFILFFQQTRRQSTAVLVWEHTSPAYVGASGPNITQSN